MDLKDILNERKFFPSKVVSMEKMPLASKNGYLSDICFLTLNLANGDCEQLILKTSLKSVEDEENKVYLAISQAVNKSELSFFHQVYPELEQTMAELQLPSPLPKCYYAGATEGGPAVVLRDLTRRGLHLPNLQTDIPESDLRSILRSLASVQAGACALQLRRQASLLELFPFLKNAFSDMLQNLIQHQLETFQHHFAKQYPDSAKLSDLFSDICLDAELNEYFFKGKDADYLLCHGDLWNNNIFINDKECILIDWQGVSAGCPIGDIATLVMTGIDLGPEPSKRFESLVLCYLDFLMECCGDNAALRRMVDQRVVPFISNAKTRKRSIQFGVKWTIASFDCFLDSTADVRTRVIKNVYNAVSEMSL